MYFIFLLTVNKSYEKTKTNGECNLVTSTACVPEADMSFLCPIKLYCPKTIENISSTLCDMFFYQHEHAYTL